jgi:hypothetical protein
MAGKSANGIEVARIKCTNPRLFHVNPCSYIDSLILSILASRFSLSVGVFDIIIFVEIDRDEMALAPTPFS